MADRSNAIQPIPVVTSYFGEVCAPLIGQTFTPGRGWRRYTFNKRVSRAWVRKLKDEGVTSVALAHAGRLADFTVAELLKGDAPPLAEAPANTSLRHGFTIRRNGNVEALTRPAVHGRPSGATVLLGSVWREGRRWRNDQSAEAFTSQEAAAKALYQAASEAV